MRVSPCARSRNSRPLTNQRTARGVCYPASGASCARPVQGSNGTLDISRRIVRDRQCCSPRGTANYYRTLPDQRTGGCVRMALGARPTDRRSLPNQRTGRGVGMTPIARPRDRRSLAPQNTRRGVRVASVARPADRRALTNQRAAGCVRVSPRRATSNRRTLTNQSPGGAMRHPADSARTRSVDGPDRTLDVAGRIVRPSRRRALCRKTLHRGALPHQSTGGDVRNRGRMSGRATHATNRSFYVARRVVRYGQIAIR
jgi:hypothetical protein